MSDIHKKEQIDDVRRRLYERGNSPHSTEYVLKDEPAPVPKGWGESPRPVASPAPQVDPRPEALTEPTLLVVPPVEKENKRRYSYRALILLAAIGMFLLVLAGTSLYLFFGTNQISNKNIGIVVTGPLTIGGGEVMPLQVTVTNQNSVPIESAVLIINYPSGTKAADDTSRDLFEERITLDRINAGEALNVPVRAVIFGEENQEREIRATIEYRLVDSNGTFYKEADPFMFKVNSSPLVLRVEAIEKVSAGQEVEVTLTVQSNSPNTLKDILVSAVYPNNFDYTQANPSPIYRESEWLIDEIAPEQSYRIVIRGLVEGAQNEEFQMQFSAGTPRQDNQFILGSILANATKDFFVEKPFIDVELLINNTKSDAITLRTGDNAQVAVTVTNTLSDTLYDMAIEIDVSGNILDRESVLVQNGFYDSTKDVVRFEVSGNQSLTEVTPGQTKRFEFVLFPNETKASPSFVVNANAYARRVSEDRATETLVGTAKREVRYSSSVTLARQVSRNSSTFTDTGPVPPVAEEKTTYTVTLRAGAGGNDVTGAVVTTALPQYVSWEQKTDGSGTIEYNPVNKEIIWNVGGIDAGSSKEISFQISMVPSQNQIGDVPNILETQRLRATDAFTGSIVRDEEPAINATLSSEAGFGKDSGKVQRRVVESPDN